MIKDTPEVAANAQRVFSIIFHICTVQEMSIPWLKLDMRLIDFQEKVPKGVLDLLLHVIKFFNRVLECKVQMLHK